jgi:hypothetical protein
MPTPNRKPALNADRRRALALLAGSPDGRTEAVMMAHGFKLDLLVELVHDGLATARAERMRVGGREIEVTSMQITETGRRALERPK